MPSYDDFEAPAYGQSLHCQVIVARGGSSFDRAVVFLHGAVESTIGTKVASERLLCLKQKRKRSSFEQTQSSKSPIPTSISSEVTFNLPASLPSVSMTGSTFVTKSSALTDRHQISGQCVTRYWLEAVFESGGVKVQRVICPVDFPKLLKPSQMTVLASNGSNCTRQPLRALRKGFAFRRNSNSMPALTLEVPHQLGIVASAPKAAGQGVQRLSIPLTVSSFDGASCCSSFRLGRTSVETRWHTRKSFGTSSAAQQVPGSTIVKGTIVRQESKLSFPPFYGAVEHENAYSSTTWLELALPESVNDSSVDMNLASISYELELEASFDIQLQNGKSVSCRSDLRLPLQVCIS